MSGILDPQKRALTGLRDAMRRAQVDEPAPVPVTVDALGPWLDAVMASHKALRREVRKKLEVAEAIVAVAPRPGFAADDAPWRRLEDACRAVESEIKTHANLRTRLDEGKRSMLPRLEQATRERLVPVVEARRAQLVARLDPEGVKALEAELPGWCHAWGEYAYRWYDADFDRVVEDAWSPREGGLPVPAPEFAPLPPPRVAADIHFPTIHLQRERTTILGGIFRHGRQGMMMLFGVVGLASQELRNDWSFRVFAALAALYIGWSGANAEREKQGETLDADARSRTEQSTRDMLRVWLDRVNDKLNEDARTQLQARRAAFVAWYRAEVLPAIDRAKTASQRTADDAERARKDIPMLQARAQALSKVEEAVAAVRSAQ